MTKTPTPHNEQMSVEEDGAEYVIVRPSPLRDCREVARIYRIDAVGKAHAHLFAAAPELLAALKGSHPFEICGIDECDSCAAIAKAEEF